MKPMSTRRVNSSLVPRNKRKSESKKTSESNCIIAEPQAKKTRSGLKDCTGGILGSSSENSTSSLKNDFDEWAKEAKWTEASTMKLIDLIKTNGFDGDFQALVKHFPGTSESSLRYLFTTMQKDAKNDNISETIAHQLIPLIREDPESQRLGVNIPLMLEWYARFGRHPDPSSVGEVDYGSIYSCIASLMRGDIPKQLNPSSAAKLDSMITILQQNMNNRTCNTEIQQKYCLPTNKPTISKEERTNILRRRRSCEWSPLERERRRIVTLQDISSVRKQYLTIDCFNPFKFPSE